jgi:ABC-type dipeptide/oligopeptide/nickel transport system ATPase subunit
VTSSLNHGDLFEIQGPSGSGKTQLALFLVMTSILPDKVKFRLGDLAPQSTTNPNEGVQELDLGGKSQTVVFVHPSTQPSPILRLAKLITTHVRNCLPPPNAGMTEQTQSELARRIVNRSLSRLTVFQVPIPSASFLPSNTQSPYASLAATLAFIPSHIRRINRELALLVVDGIGDGFWHARWQREQRIKEKKPRASPAGIRSSENASMDDVVGRIDKIRRDLGCAVVVTNQAIWKPLAEGKNQGPASQYWSQHLPPPYPSPFEIKRSDHHATSTKTTPYWPLTAHITLLPPTSGMRQMRPDVLLYEVLRKDGEGDKREQARLRARGKGLVRLPAQMSGAQAGEFSFAVKDGEINSW